MSAIYGAVDLKNTSDFSVQAEKYKKEYSAYAVEHVDNIISGSAFMGCAHQYFTPEAERDVLPVEEPELLFTADCFLDNHIELKEAMQLPSDTPDGAVILAAFKKWKKDVIKHLHGSFSFAIYDKEAREVMLANDRFAQRCLFYTVRGSQVHFSTLFYPLLRNSGLDFKKNNRWLLDSISMRGPVMMSECRETAVDSVYKVVSGTFVTISLGSDDNAIIEEHEYYRPKDEIKVNRKITPKKSEDMIKDVMYHAVGRILRNKDHIGAQLSRGLDSTSVACTAAILMAREGKSINSYTSVPLKEANLDNKGYLVYDETSGVMKVVEAYPNIKPHFIDTAGRNYLQEADNIIRLWELPCKSQQNSIWSDEIYKQAAADGVKIMLTGATGNCTISAGSIENSLYDHLKHLRFIKAYKSLGVAKKVGVPPKRYLRNLWNLYKNYRKWVKENHSFYEENFTRSDIGEAYKLSTRMVENNGHYLPFEDLKAMRKVMFFQKANAQIGEVDTKTSLTYGVLPRDPMRTHDMMQLCYSLPIECFSWDDYDRRLVREGMAGIVPEFIRHDVRHRGRQSGDIYYRLSLVWDDVLPVIKNQLYSPSTLDYLDKKKIAEWLDTLTRDNLEENSNKTLMVVDAYSFSLYVNQLDKLISK